MMNNNNNTPTFHYNENQFVAPLHAWSCQICQCETFIWPYCLQHALSEAHLRIAPSGMGDFLGLFADANLTAEQEQHCRRTSYRPIVFTAHTSIAEYIGEYLTIAQYNKRYQVPGQCEDDVYGPYAVDYNSQAARDQAFLDSALWRCYGAFINSAPQHHKAAENVDLQYVSYDFASKHGQKYPGKRNQRWLRVTTKRDIRHGDELLWYYGDSYWGNNNNSNSIPDISHHTEWYNYITYS